MTQGEFLIYNERSVRYVRTNVHTYVQMYVRMFQRLAKRGELEIHARCSEGLDGRSEASNI